MKLTQHDMTMIKIIMVCGTVLMIVMFSFLGGCNMKLPEPVYPESTQDTCYFESLQVDIADPWVGNFYVEFQNSRAIIKDHMDDEFYIIIWKTVDGWRAGEDNIDYELILTPYEIVFSPVEMKLYNEENPVYHLRNKVCP